MSNKLQTVRGIVNVLGSVIEMTANTLQIASSS
jgi:hypothetical protein